VLLLRRLVLRLDQKFARNTSWRFIDSRYRFPDQLNPFAEIPPAARQINNLDGQLLDVDFIGIKIGDINGNVDLDATNANQVELRSQAEAMPMVLIDEKLIPGRTYSVALNLKDLKSLLGLQYSLQFDPNALELSQVHYAALQEEDISWNDLERGMLHFSWNKGLSSGENESTMLCTLEFTALEAINLRAALHLSTRILRPEAYTSDLLIHPIQLVWKTKGDDLTFQQDLVFQLYQNRPNPFGNDTVIEFDLPFQERATLIVRDLAGRILYRTTADYLAGHHQITLSKSILGASGLLYYSLETPNFAATKKMVVLNTE
jgi:hypothetical protein